MSTITVVEQPAAASPGTRSPWGLLVAIIAVTVLLRIPSFFEPHWYNDEGIFASVAHGMLRGQLLYAQIWDHKPPLIYGLYAAIIFLFGDSIPALRFASTAAVAATQVLIFVFARRLLSDKRALIAAALYGVLTAIPFLEGMLALTEVFMVVATTGAMTTYAVARSARPWQEPLSNEHWIAIGLLFGIGSAFKPVAILDVAALVVFVVMFESGRVRAVASLAIGFASVWAMLLALFAVLGALPAFLDANLIFQVAYVRDLWWRPELRVVVIVGPPLLALVYVGLNRQRSLVGLVVLWAGLAMTGSVVGGLPFSHYLIQAFPALSILAVYAFGMVRTRRTVIPMVALWVVVLLSIWRYTDSFTTNDFTRMARYYRDFAASLIYREPERFYDTFTFGYWRPRDVVNMLERVGATDQPVLVYGNFAWTYPLANVRPVGRFVMESHIKHYPERQRELLLSMARDAPSYIVVQNDVTPFPALEAVILTAYRCQQIPGFLFCQRNVLT